MSGTLPPPPEPRPDDVRTLSELVLRVKKLETLLCNALADTAAAGISCSNAPLLERMTELETAWTRMLADLSRETETVCQGLELMTRLQESVPAEISKEINAALQRISMLARAFDTERERLLARLTAPLQAESCRLKRHLDVLKQYQHQAPPSRDGWKT